MEEPLILRATADIASRAFLGQVREQAWLECVVDTRSTRIVHAVRRFKSSTP
jgi:hypothetical protein